MGSSYTPCYETIYLNARALFPICAYDPNTRTTKAQSSPVITSPPPANAVCPRQPLMADGAGRRAQRAE
eukprot:5527716-Pyramimonas_sp.AAC.1